MVDTQMNNGGMQYIPQIAAVQQIVYLDFDGENTSYNGEILALENVEVQSSELSAERIAFIVAELNARFAGQNLLFVTERPAAGEYSTVFVGKTDSFSDSGNIAGIAETIDRNNANKSDKAFVMLDASNSDEEIISVIAHEVGHLTGTLEHGGEGLAAYAANVIISSGTTLSGVIVHSGTSMVVSKGNSAVGTIVNSGGILIVQSGATIENTSGTWATISVAGGVASQTVLNGGAFGIRQGASANGTIINSGHFHIVNGGVANSTTVFGGGVLVSSGGLANNTFLTYSGGYSNGIASMFVYDAGSANVVVVGSRGLLRVTEGGIVNSAIQNSGGIIELGAGAVANNTILNDGTLFVSSGVTVNGTVINPGAEMNITPGALVDSTVINRGELSVSSGVSISNTVVDSFGHLVVTDGGIAAGVTVNAGGILYVYGRGQASDITLKAGGIFQGFSFAGDLYISEIVNWNAEIAPNVSYSSRILTVSSGGVVNGVGVNYNNTLVVSSGGTASIAFNPFENGTIDALEGALVTYLDRDANIYYRGDSALVTKFNSADNMNIASGQIAVVYSGGVLRDTVVNGGTLHIEKGVVHYGSLQITNGGRVRGNGGEINLSLVDRTSADDYLINDLSAVSDAAFTVTVGEHQAGGIYKLAQNAVDNSVTISVGDGSVSYGMVSYNSSLTYNYKNYSLIFSAGNLLLNVELLPSVFVYSNGVSISSGRVISGYSLQSGESMRVNHGGLADSTTLTTGTLYVLNGGTAANTVVSGIPTGSRGEVFVSSGGTASNTIIEAFGYVRVWGGKIEDTTIGGDAEGAATANILMGGIAVNTTVNSRASLAVSDGITENTTVNAGGILTVRQGGVAVNTTVNSRGVVRIEGGSAANTVISRMGNMTVYDGVAENTTVLSGGMLGLGSGAVHRGTLFIAGTSVGASSGSIIDFTVAGRTIEDDYLINDLSLIVDSPTYTITVSDNQAYGTYKLAQGAANFSGSITVGNGSVDFGRLTVNGNILSYGNADYLLRRNNGNLLLDIRNTANPYVFIYSGNELTSSGKIINGAILSSGGNDVMYVSSGGVVNSTTVNAGFMHVLSGGAAETTLVNGGKLDVSSGGAANNTVVQDGFVYISGGAAANSLTLVSSATVNVYGTLNNVYAGDENQGNSWPTQAKLQIYSGGVVDSATIAGGRLTLYGGAASNVILNSGSIYFDVKSSGSEIDNVTVNSGGIVQVAGGTANNVAINNGAMYVSNGGAVTGTLVNSQGKMYVTENGTAWDTVVASRGYLYIAGGTHRGTLQMETGAFVLVQSGGVIDFTVSGRTAQDDYLINDLSLIGRAPDYTITVSDTQAFGTYKLAQGAADISLTVIIGNGSVNFGTLTVNGDALSCGSTDYQLLENNGDLTLAVGDFSAPELVITGNPIEWTNKDVTLTATANEGTIEYFDGSKWVTGNTLVVTSNGTYTFRVTDGAGNSSEKEVIVDKIDKVLPSLEISGNPVEWTNQDVVLTAVANEEGRIEYFNGSEWVLGAEQRVSANGTYKFRVTDRAGNVTEESVVVDRIDKVLPTLEITGNITEWTNKDVTLFATANEGTIEYFDGSKWVAGNSLVVSENGSYTFRVTDAAGNVAEKIIVIDKIDKVLPSLEITRNVTEWTNQDVVLTAIFNEGSVEFFNGTEWIPGAEQRVSANGTYKFRVTDPAGNVTEKSIVVDNIDKVAPAQPVAFPSNEEATYDPVIVRAEFSEDSVVKEYSFDNKNWHTYSYGVSMIANGSVFFRGVDIAGNISSVTEYVVGNIYSTVPENLQGSADSLSWNDNPLAPGWNVEISQDDFAGILQVKTDNSTIDILVMPDGTYQWRVSENGRDEYACGEDITVSNGNKPPQEVISNSNGFIDIFFAKTNGVWGSGYAAQHIGTIDGWQGTQEHALLEGKNKITDVFVGSSDANVLILTDKSNGDVLFVDDIYSTLGDQARLSQIDEIRAGYGDDIIDMTSQQFVYTGEGITIYGGDGNDTIWVNNGNNILYGDAGCDRIVGAGGDDIIIGGSGDDMMHGGGGDDIFIFGSYWGRDTVEQLSTGSVTLWFEYGEERFWNPETMTYRADGNTVTVKGDVEVTLKFGADASLPEGAFAEAASGKIFEDKSKGFIA